MRTEWEDGINVQFEFLLPVIGLANLLESRVILHVAVGDEDAALADAEEQAFEIVEQAQREAVGIRGGGADRFLEFLVVELLPYLEEQVPGDGGAKPLGSAARFGTALQRVGVAS